LYACGNGKRVVAARAVEAGTQRCEPTR